MIDFYCKQKDLKEAVAKVIKAVPSKAQMPALECIKLDVNFSGTVDFTGFDLTTGIKDLKIQIKKLYGSVFTL